MKRAIVIRPDLALHPVGYRVKLEIRNRETEEVTEVMFFLFHFILSFFIYGKNLGT